jgi:hypothetical protein
MANNDSNEAVNRYNTFSDDATDDDGRLVKNEEEEPVYPEVPAYNPTFSCVLK